MLPVTSDKPVEFMQQTPKVVPDLIRGGIDGGASGIVGVGSDVSEIRIIGSSCIQVMASGLSHSEERLLSSYYGLSVGWSAECLWLKNE